ncbi:MAG: glycosyltransferase [Planctomycetota bacterium]
MPTYNAERFVEAAIDSVLAQTVVDFELIIVDDGSTDRTLELIQGYEAADARVRVFQADHGGGSRAMNRGAAEARGDWIAVMHADDEAMPDRLVKQAAAAVQTPGVVVWGSYGQHINERGQVLGLSCFGPTSMREFEERFADGRDVNVLHPTAMLRRDVFEQIGGYDPSFQNCEDMELFTRMAHHGGVVVVPEPLVRYRLHANTNSMKRFFVQRENTHYVRARRRAEIDGRPVVSLETFRQQRATRPWWTKLRERFIDVSHYQYRHAAMCFGQRRFIPAGWRLGLATLMNPGYCARKAWNQVLSPQSRRMLKGGVA